MGKLHAAHAAEKKLDIFPSVPFCRRISQKVCRVISADNLDSEVIVDFPAESADRLVGLKKVLRGDRAETAYIFGGDRTECPFQEGAAARRFVREGIAVLRGSAPDDIA